MREARYRKVARDMREGQVWYSADLYRALMQTARDLTPTERARAAGKAMRRVRQLLEDRKLALVPHPHLRRAFTVERMP